MSVGDIGRRTDWHVALTGCDVVVHLAARAHLIQVAATCPLADFREVNVEGTINLARQADRAGVKRFVFVSSIGANGAETFDSLFIIEDKPVPHSPYAISKREAEVALQELAP